MLKIFAVIMLCIATVFATEEVAQLEQQLAQLHEKTSAAGKFAQLAGHVMKNKDQAEATDAILEQQFSALGDQGAGPLIAKRNIKSHEEAVTSRSYYLGVRDNLFAAEVVLALEIMALQSSAMNQSQRAEMNTNFSKTYDGMKEMLKDSNLGIPAIEKKDISTEENALAARIYYKEVKDNLLGRTKAMAKGENFG